jgi:hypothetical protein
MDVLDQYLDEVQATMERDPTQREGQAYFNAFRLRWPELQGEVIGTDCDPFSNDRSLPAFLAWLQARLSEPGQGQGESPSGSTS